MAVAATPNGTTVQTNTYAALASTTLAATANSINITGISQNYTDLVIVIVGYQYTSNSWGSVQIRFNGAASTDYSSTYIMNYGGSLSGVNYANVSDALSGVRLPDNTAGASTAVGNIQIDILNYSSATSPKMYIGKNFVGRVDQAHVTQSGGGQFRPAGAITSVSLTAVTDPPLNVGTVMTIYGIKAA